MYHSGGLRIDPKHSQARHIGMIRDSQRLVYDWAIERLLADPALTAYDLSKEFTKLRRSTELLRTMWRICQNTATHQARTAAYRFPLQSRVIPSSPAAQAFRGAIRLKNPP